MSSYINVYGRTRKDRQWMRRRYASADAVFRSIHPVINVESMSIDLVNHSIDTSNEPWEHGVVEYNRDFDRNYFERYYWHILCHGESGEHFDQTKRDVRKVLAGLNRPRGIQVHLSPG